MRGFAGYTPDKTEHILITGGTCEIRTPGGLFSDFLLIFHHFIFSPTKAEFAPLKPTKKTSDKHRMFL